MTEKDKKFRLVTRSDFDGLVCGVLLKELDLIDDFLFVHPKDMQDGNVDVTDRDITTNLPYVPNCHLAFDHHASEVRRVGSSRAENHIMDHTAPSTARVVYNHFGGADAFPNVSTEMLQAVDRCDAARFTEDEILNPRGWVLLNFIMDPRTGLQALRHFIISNYELMARLIDACRTQPIEKILELPDVKERMTLFSEQMASAMCQIKRCAQVREDLVVLDLRSESTVYVCNRFLVYALYPECSISMHILRGLKQQNTVFAIGKSIFKRTNPVHIGELTLEYGGGGHKGAGTCQVENQRAERVKRELIERITTVDAEPLAI